MLETIKQHGMKIAAIGTLGALLVYTALRDRFVVDSEKHEQKAEEIIMHRNQSKINNRVVRICITGGPCGGKTTGMTCAYEALEKQFMTLIVPEAATLIAASGGMLNTSYYNQDELLQFQYTLLKAQMLLQSTFVEIGLNQKSNNLVVILCDRGLMDGKAYMKETQWTRMLQKYNIEETTIRDDRYDAVIHLVTAADGAQKFYTTANNTARHQSVSQAMQLDSQTRQAWFGHPEFHVIDNKTWKTFDQKIKHMVEIVKGVVYKKKLELFKVKTTL